MGKKDSFECCGEGYEQTLAVLVHPEAPVSTIQPTR